jgi:hypothetical protein
MSSTKVAKRGEVCSLGKIWKDRKIGEAGLPETRLGPGMNSASREDS